MEGMALLCDENHDLLVRVGPFTGRIPREETALGISDGSTRDIAILSRVGKPVCFCITALEGHSGRITPPALPPPGAGTGTEIHSLLALGPGDPRHRHPFWSPSGHSWMWAAESLP